jgi:hypothetical protein
MSENAKSQKAISFIEERIQVHKEIIEKLQEKIKEEETRILFWGRLEEDVALEIMNKYFENNKPPTLFERFKEWVAIEDFCQSSDVIANNLSRIVREWLPPEHETNDYKWNQCIKTIKSKLGI